MAIWFVRILLLSGALTAIVLAFAILFLPGPFYAGYEIHTSGQVSLLNELKAPALLILIAGLVQAVGVLRAGWMYRGLLAGAVLFLSFGLSRTIAMVLDGPPSIGLVWVLAIEIALGMLFALALWGQNRFGPG